MLVLVLPYNVEVNILNVSPSFFHYTFKTHLFRKSSPIPPHTVGVLVLSVLRSRTVTVFRIVNFYIIGFIFHFFVSFVFYLVFTSGYQ